jgi:conjugative transfer signal peptidase TraF
MRRPLKIVLTTACCLIALVVAAMLAGVRINTTPSYPLGIYIMTDAPIEKGTLVIFCPTDSPAFYQAREWGYIGAGFCPGGYGYMIKKIMAAKNDKVEISAAGVSINGELLPNSNPMDTDSEGKPLPNIEVNIAALDDHSVLLMSDYNPKSFDGRYFGLMDKSQIISAIRPVWTW